MAGRRGSKNEGRSRDKARVREEAKSFVGAGADMRPSKSRRGIRVRT